MCSIKESLWENRQWKWGDDGLICSLFVAICAHDGFLRNWVIISMALLT